MAVDIRANVTCNLGNLISGTISDDYIQGSGLVKTKGSCEFAEILTPSPGDIVTFKYGKDGKMTDIPRKLRVLSSFADPLRNTTKVELGCILTYLEGLGPTPSEDGLSKSDYDARRQQCLNGYLEYPRDSVVPPPIKASAVMDECLKKLGISASGDTLTNVFMIDKFDLSPGYVSVLSDLLLSESYCGFLDYDETLQIVKLTKEGGSGSRIDQSLLIDIGPIGVGDLPADAVLVRYEGLKLEGDVDPADTSSQAQRDWEEEEVIGDPEEYPVRYTRADGNVVNLSYRMTPYSKVTTQYGKNNAWDDTQCYISGKEGVDLSDKPIKRTTATRTIKAQAASNYCAQVLSSNTGVNPEPGLIGEQRSEVEYEYDEKGELKRSVDSTYQPFYMWAGGIDVDFVYADGAVTLGAGDVLTEQVVTDYENIYAPQPTIVFLKEGEEYEPLVLGQKVTTTRYLNWALTQQGQQAIASIKDGAPFNTANECSRWLNLNSDYLVQDSCQVQTNRGRTTVGGQARPGKADRVINAKGSPSGSSVAKLVYATGGANAERTLVLSMPYQSTPYFTPAGKVVPGDGGAKAIRYGRVQNRLFLGNRYGVSIQLHPSKMPKSPFDPFYLEIGQLSVQYRANAATWAFSSDGVIGSMDALFWGAAGGTVSSGSGSGGSGPGSGTTTTKPWVPLPPGNTPLPPLPVPDADGNINVPSLVPPWTETVLLLGRTRTRLVVKDYPYAIGGTTETAALVTRTKAVVGYRLAADAGSFAFTGTAQPIKLRAGVGSFVLSGLPAGATGFRAWRVNGVTFNMAGQNVNLPRTFAPLVADTGLFVFEGKPAGRFRGIALKAEVNSFALGGQDANRRRTYQLTANAGTLSLTGLSAALTYTAIAADWTIANATGAPFLGATVSSPSASWTTLVSAYSDDQARQTAAFGFDFVINSATFTSCYVSSNGLIAFGAASTTASPGPSTPSIPNLVFYGGDRSYNRVYTISQSYQSLKFFKIRWEGRFTYGSGASDAFVEITFFERPASSSQQFIELRFGTIATSPGIRIGSGSVYYAQTAGGSYQNTSYVLTGNANGTSWLCEAGKSVVHAVA